MLAQRAAVIMGFLFSSLYPLAAQDNPADWDHFQIMGDFVDAIETETDIWFAHRYQIRRWNKAQQELLYPDESSPWFIRNAKDFYEHNGEYYLLAERTLWHLQGETWRSIWGGFAVPSEGRPIATKIIGTHPDGLLLQSADGAVYTGYLEPAYVELELSPWNRDWWPDRSFQQGADGSMWAWSPQRLVRWQGEDLTEFPIPVPGDSIITAVPGTNHFQWVLSDQHLSFYANGWTNVPWTNLSDRPLSAHHVLSETSIFLTFENEVMVLRFSGNSYELIVQKAHPKHKHPGQQFFLADDGKLWYMDHLLKQLHYFTPNWNLQTINEHDWLPTNELRPTHLTNDRDGHLWVCTPDRAVYYAGEEWYAGEEAYPGFPKGVSQLQFTAAGTPIVFSPKGSNESTSPFLQQFHQGQWIAYPLPDDGSGFTPADASNLILDKADNIWLFRPGSPVVFTWDRYSWITISTIDFPSRPASFQSMAFDQDNNLLLDTRTGIIKHDRRTSEAFTYDELGIQNPAIILNHIAVDDQNTHWFGGQALYKWSFDQTVETIQLPSELGNVFHFYGIYSFGEEELWITAGGNASSQYVYRLDSNGNWVPSAYDFYPFFQGAGELIEQDTKGRIWLIDGVGVDRFTRSVSDATTTSQHNTKLNAYPNPSCCHVQLSWQSTNTAPTSLKLHNAQGQLVYDILVQEGHVGKQQLVIPRNELPAGIYFAALQQGDQTETVKVVFK